MICKLNELDPSVSTPQVVRLGLIGVPGFAAYSAWILDESSQLGGGYSTCTYGRREDGSVARFGQLGTETLPGDLEALRPGPERTARVRRWQAGVRSAALDVVVAALGGDVPAGHQVDDLMVEVSTWSHSEV